MLVSKKQSVNSQRDHSGSSERESQKKKRGRGGVDKRENRRKRWEGECERGETGVMSCLWPERREEPRDMTDYRRGQSSRPMPRPQRSVMGAGRGTWGTERGANKKGMSW